MPFHHTTELPKGSSSLEIALDDKCLKFHVQYVNDGKCHNQVHYIGRDQIQELRDYLKAAQVDIEMQVLETA